MSVERRDARRLAVHAALVVLAYVTAAAFVRFYMRGERYFYYWDLAVYHDLALRTADAFRRLGLVEAFHTLYRSTSDDYNAIFAVPLFPLLTLLGETRASYVLGLTLLYQVPFFLALGSIAAKLLPERRGAAFWSTVAVAYATPMSWIPTLRGFPDVGAALLIALAVRLFLEDPWLDSWSHRVTIGVLLAAATLFRRPFLFAAAALLASMVVLALSAAAGHARRGGSPAASEAARGLLKIGFVGAVAGATLLLVGRRFLLLVFEHDYASLYSGYQVSPSQALTWYVKPYGVAACLIAIAGFAFAFRTRVADRAGAAFVAVFSALSVLVWLLLVRQLGEQYTLHFTPAIVLGCSLFGWILVRAASDLVGPPALATAGACLACNLLYGLSGHPKMKQESPLRDVFAANWPPMRRTDYDEMGRLLRVLHDEARPDDPVFVAASSHTINHDIVAQVERDLFGRSRSRLTVLATPALDSGDVYPLETLLQAHYVVLVHPFQHHLPPEEQRVVKVVLDLFDEGRDLARDFEPIEGAYRLEFGAVATVQRRIRPTSDAVAIRTLRYMCDRVGRRPGMQPDWIVLSELYPSLTRRSGADSWSLLTHPTRRNAAPEARWLHIRQTEDAVRATGRVRMIYGVCPGITLAFSAVDETGFEAPLGEVSRRQEDDGAFALDLRPGRGRWLVLRLKSPPWRDSIHACQTWLEGVRVAPATEP